VEKVKDFAGKMPEASGKSLRVFIQGGGCSGFQYGFTFDDQKPNDIVIAAKDISVLVDKTSAGKLHGATVDWLEDFRGAGFSVDNPNATSGCGCGKSFS
jgi:iron-sulfur cluster assembly accessory protein